MRYSLRISQPSFPKLDWAPLEYQPVVDRGTFADPSKYSLLRAATRVRQLTPAIGVELEGIDLRQLTPSQKDELSVVHPSHAALPSLTCVSQGPSHR